MHHAVKALAIGIIGGLIMGVGLQAAWAEDYYQMDDNAVLHFQQGQVWMEARQYKAAINEFQMGIKLKPSATMTASLYNNMGLAYLKIAQFGKAIVSFQKAISINPNFSLYYENLAKVYRISNTQDSAIEKLQQITVINPSDAQAWFLLGVLYRDTQQADKARTAFETYLQLAPHSDLALAAQQHMTALNEPETP